MAALQLLQSPGGDLVLWYNKANHAISGSIVLVHSDTAKGLVVDFLLEFVLPLRRNQLFLSSRNAWIRTVAHQHFDKGRVCVLQQSLRTSVSNVLGRTAGQHVDQRSDDKMLGIRNFRQYFSETHFLYLFLALYLLADISIASNTTCYYPDGLESKGSPCNPTANVSTCCGPGFVCLGNGLCTPGPNDRKTYDYKFYRSSCTDSTWKSSACPNFCLGRRCRNSIFF